MFFKTESKIGSIPKGIICPEAPLYKWGLPPPSLILKIFLKKLSPNKYLWAVHYGFKSQNVDYCILLFSMCIKEEIHFIIDMIKSN